MEYKTIRITDEKYPSLLASIKDPPSELYCAGDEGLMHTRCIAVVGSRKLSDYGRRIAYRIGEKLGRAGVTVVSGMAKGVDSMAHKGALDAGGKTIAVMGTAIGGCYPTSNRALKEQIIREGLVISEYPHGYPTEKGNFPRRNRIISGLSEATIIAEARLNSGALITAGLAADQGRAVYAVPANIDNPSAIGGNLLIRDGALPLVVIDDILEEMNIEHDLNEKIEAGDLSPEERRLIDEIAKGSELTVDELCARTGLGPAEVNGIATVLEIKGLIHSSLGKIFLAK